MNKTVYYETVSSDKLNQSLLLQEEKECYEEDDGGVPSFLDMDYSGNWTEMSYWRYRSNGHLDWDREEKTEYEEFLESR